MFAVTAAAVTARRQWLKSLGLLAACPSRVPTLSAYAYQRSVSLLLAYHQLRSAIAQVGGRKQLTGRTDLDMAISNQCARLIANVIIAYNSVLLSKLLERYQATDNQKAI